MFATENLTAFRKSERTKASFLLLHTYSALENVNTVKSAVGMSLRLCFAYVKPRAPGFTVTVPIGSASESAQSTSDEVSTTRQSRRDLVHQHFFFGGGTKQKKNLTTTLLVVVALGTTTFQQNSSLTRTTTQDTTPEKRRRRRKKKDRKLFTTP
jgi:hypothetical protein